ncbi:MAG TPA: SufD family Fe-S cluster assembly protein [Dehalococcoidia bacterium]|nr:SufD family Fe-S cluster assembly protein [Dehalococcoidia bacterium]
MRSVSNALRGVYQVREIKSSKTYRDKAKAASTKPAAIGEDVDLTNYVSSAEAQPYQSDPSELPAKTKEQMLEAGVILDDVSQRSGTFIQTDNTPVHFSSWQEGIEVMPVSQALENYDWLSDYWWQAVAVDTDKYTANVELSQSNGYFIRALPGTKTIYPVQACLYLAKGKLAQNIHNIIIAEENSELHIITGCTTASKEEPGLHLGVSEFYIKRGAKITFTMIHSWNPEVAVRPRTAAIVEEDGLFLSNYVLMKPVRSLQMYPTARCVGENAVVRYNSILVAAQGSALDVGSRAILNAKGAKTEIISRAITTGGNIIARGYIEGNAPEVKGHLECRGLILQGEGVIHAIPELKGTLDGIDLSHEAAVGKIAEEEVEYLMARGLTRAEATATIVRGFLEVDIEGLPPLLSAELQRAIESSEKELM